ncbi:hypothetical protein ACLOJK_036474 [Asimina triloba]
MFGGCRFPPLILNGICVFRLRHPSVTDCLFLLFFSAHVVISLVLSPSLRSLSPLHCFRESRGREVEVERMGRGEAEEGVTATDFFWSYTDEPHASRRRQILSQYPEIKQLFGPDPWAFIKVPSPSHFFRGFLSLWDSTFFFLLVEGKLSELSCLCLMGCLSQITVVVLLQLWTATWLHSASWLWILIVAYFFGSFLNHNLFLAIHELSHNLAFSTPVYNRWLGIFANLPIGVPMSITFQKYHLEHHRFQGVDGVDMDIPSHAEARLIKNVITKSIWVIFQLFFYALRPLFLNPKPPGLWEFTNLVIQLTLDAAMVYFYGWKSLGYLILSTFVGGGMHPMAAHFISEHYIFHPDQETYSYYGPLNLMTWGVGYHNEHHDFPRIPGSRLHKVKAIAPEFYKDFMFYKSWSQVIFMYIMDCSVGPFSRMKRMVWNSNKTKKDE